MVTDENVVMSPWVAAQLALHVKLAAHHAAIAGTEPCAAEAVLAWAVLVASGGADVAAPMDTLPAAAEVIEDASVLPAYRAAADQAEQLLAHFDYEERFELATLYGKVLLVIEDEIERLSEPPPGRAGRGARG